MLLEALDFLLGFLQSLLRRLQGSFQGFVLVSHSEEFLLRCRNTGREVLVVQPLVEMPVGPLEFVGDQPMTQLKLENGFCVQDSSKHGLCRRMCEIPKWMMVPRWLLRITSLARSPARSRAPGLCLPDWRPLPAI